jgi:hypothetical protein
MQKRFALVYFILVLVSCGTESKLVSGRWKMQRVLRSDTQIMYEHPFLQEFDFNSDGTVSVDISGGGWGGTYNLRGDSVLLNHPSGFVIGRKIDKLTMQELEFSFINEDYIITEFYTK